jgi:hypothetical protein
MIPHNEVKYYYTCEMWQTSFLHKLYLHLELYIYTSMHAKHNDDNGWIYPIFDTVNEVSGFKSRTSHLF